jgi:hypothetical protein
MNTYPPEVQRVLLTLRERVAQATEQAGLELSALGYQVAEDLPLRPTRLQVTGRPVRLAGTSRSGSTASVEAAEPRADS